MGKNVTIERKTSISSQHRGYLELIQAFGRDMLLQKHVIALAVAMGVAGSVAEATLALMELEEAQVVKKIDWEGSGKFVVFKKFAIRFLAGLDSSQKVAAASKVNSNSTFRENAFKSQFILERVIPAMQKRGMEITTEGIKQYLLEQQCSNLLISKNRGEQYYVELLKKFPTLIKKVEVATTIERLQGQKAQRLSNLQGGQMDVNVKVVNTTSKADSGITKENKDQKLKRTADFSTLLRRNVYVVGIKHDQEAGTMVVYMCYYNTAHATTTHKMALNYAIARDVLERTFNIPVDLKFVAMVPTEEEKVELEQDMYKMGYNPIKHKHREVPYFWDILLDLDFMDIEPKDTKVEITTL